MRTSGGELLVVHRNAGHLLALVNDLLAVASERVDLSLEEADLAQLVTEVVTSAVPQASLTGLQLDLDVEQPLLAGVDPERIRQVVRNLLSNAVKYSPGGVRITVCARNSGGQPTCSITDTGLGMDADEQEQAFTKFFRSARSRSTAIPGAGLGLPVSKNVYPPACFMNHRLWEGCFGTSSAAEAGPDRRGGNQKANRTRRCAAPAADRPWR